MCDVNRQIVFIKLLQQTRKFCHGAAVDWDGAVPATSTYGGFHPTDLFLGNHDRIKTLLTDVQTEATELADRITNILEQLRVMLHEEFCAVIATNFFIADERKQNIAGRL